MVIVASMRPQMDHDPEQTELGADEMVNSGYNARAPGWDTEVSENAEQCCLRRLASEQW